jgi:formate hydrogenlyase transcriptional activator
MSKLEHKTDILVVDDSEESLHVLVSIIEEQGYVARPVTQGLLAVRTARLSPPELILLDIGLPDINGYQVCEELKADESTREIPILFISGLHATADKVKALAAGGVDYITKPFQVDEIKARINTHLSVRHMQTDLRQKNVLLLKEISERQRAEKELQAAHDELEQRVRERTLELQTANEALHKALKEIEQLKARVENENVYLREEVGQRKGGFSILGQSKATGNILTQIAQVASTDTTVLILGETGTGKELVARTIHEQSPRASRTMVTVNCAALPSGIVESELFGRSKGAYTGASTDQPGRFEVADGSSIFLDEIGELPNDLQAKLLRVLQDGTFERLGSTKTVRVNVRVIAATNRDLEAAVSGGRFRQDLYYRLNVFPIVVPPLRERTEDITVLTKQFVKEFSVRMGKPPRPLSPVTLQRMERYPWPGNIRELRNVLERAMIVSTGETLDVHLPDTPPPCADGTYELEETERRHILSVLEKTNWRVKGKDGAAERLGLKPTTLQSKMKKLGISRISS